MTRNTSGAAVSRLQRLVALGLVLVMLTFEIGDPLPGIANVLSGAALICRPRPGNFSRRIISHRGHHSLRRFDL